MRTMPVTGVIIGTKTRRPIAGIHKEFRYFQKFSLKKIQYNKKTYNIHIYPKLPKGPTYEIGDQLIMLHYYVFGQIFNT